MAAAVATSAHHAPAINIVSPPRHDPSVPRNPASRTAEPGSPDSSTSNSTTLSSAPSASSSSSSPPQPGMGSTGDKSGSHAPVVPQYPYNVSMPQFQGALLPYDRAPTADDNDVQTRLPSICVDYLSHDWDESDVWTSWKAMTRHKHELANGVRLENASWRTWAKQRNNLKTISPETLNWLKDSDVTWLYGPLHTAVDPVPPPKQASLQDRLSLDTDGATTTSAPSSRPASALGGTGQRPSRPAKAPGKPILKHRSLSEILGVPGGGPTSPTMSESAFDPSSEDEDTVANTSGRHVTIAGIGGSDTTLHGSPRHHIVREPSPSAGLSIGGVSMGDESPDAATTDDDEAHSREGVARPTPVRARTVSSGDESAAGSTRSSLTSGSGQKRTKKHISFSHRVEQCIAVDGDDEHHPHPHRSGGSPFGGLGGAAGRSSAIGDDDDDDDEEEDDALMFRSSVARYGGYGGGPSNPTAGGSGFHRPGQGRQSANFVASSNAGAHANLPLYSSQGTAELLNGREPLTIARMAPTTLKSSEEFPAPSPVVVYHDDAEIAAPSWLAKGNFEEGREKEQETVTATPTASNAPGETVSNLYSRTYGTVPNAQPGPDPSAQPSAPAGAAGAAGAASPPSDSNASGTSGASLYGRPASVPAQQSEPEESHLRSGWDDDTDDYAPMMGGFDYFAGSTGPDFGVGDEYDMPALPSQHLASGAQATYAPRASPRESKETSPTASGATSPRLPRSREPSTGSSGEVEVGGGKTIPKSILKNAAVASPTVAGGQAPPSVRLTDPTEAISASPPQIMGGLDGNRSKDFGLGSGGGGATSPGPDRPDRQSRGRSSSRGSSASSIDRSTGADRRTSPSQSPPSTLAAQIAAARTGGGGSGRNSRQSSSGSLHRSGSSGDLQGWKGGGFDRGGGGVDSEESSDEAAGADEGGQTRFSSRAGKGSQAMNESEVVDSRAKGKTASPAKASNQGVTASRQKGKLVARFEGEAEAGPTTPASASSAILPPPSDSGDSSSTAASTNTDGAASNAAATSQQVRSSPIDIKGAIIPQVAAAARRLLSAPRPATVQLAGEDSDNENGFDSPSLPASPTASEIGRGVGVSANGSFSSLSSLRWSDEQPVSYARRSLLRNTGVATSSSRVSGGTFREVAKQQRPHSWHDSEDEVVPAALEAGAIGSSGSRPSSLDARRFSDDFAFGYGYDEDEGGVVNRASEILATTKDLVGALWTVGSRSWWGAKSGGAAVGTDQQGR